MKRTSASVVLWALVVVMGILVPFIMSIVEYYEYGEMPKALVVGADVLVLVGGMSLRALIVFSGQPPQII